MKDMNRVSTILLFIFICIQMKGNFARIERYVPSDVPRLMSASVLFRHGDRNPLFSYPKDPHKKVKWPGGYAALTDIGKEQEYKLGQFLRKRYESLLGGGHYLNDNVYVQSTNIDRTLRSAQWCLNGIFPSVSGHQQHWNIPFRSFPIHTVPKADDYLLGMAKECPLYENEMKKYEKNAQFKKFLNKNKKLFKYLSKKSGWQVKSFNKMFNLYDILYIENLKGKRLPSWAVSIITPNGNVERDAIKGLQLRTGTTILARLKAGFLIREILENFTRKINRTSSRSLYLYSAHDTTITDALNSLQLFDGRKVSYAASVHFELYEWRNWFYIQIFYKNSNEEELTPLFIPNCGEFCPLSDFQSIYRKIIPTGSFEDECRD